MMPRPSWWKWYGTARWQRLRMQVLARDLFTCAECGRIEGNTSKLVAHHKKPHRGNSELFWDPANIIVACRPCHDGPIKAREKRETIPGCWY